MKSLFTLSLVVFWAGVTALVGAALVVYELKPNTVNSEQAQEQTQTQTRTVATDSTSVLDHATIAIHDQATDCWIIVEDYVYNVTDYIPFHPGGEQMITDTCGGDATEDFSNRDGQGTQHSSSARTQLEQYVIDKLGTTLAEDTENIVETTNPNTETDTPDTTNKNTKLTPPSTAPTQTTISLTSSEVTNHTSSNDCWVIVDGNVYNVTEYIPFHPGGSGRITNRCGTDVSADFAGAGGHRHSSSARNTLSRYLVGAFEGSVTQTTPTPNTDSTNTHNPPSSNPIENSIQAKYPGAVIIKVEYEDDGRSEVKFNWNGKKYEAKLNSQNKIVDVDD